MKNMLKSIVICTIIVCGCWNSIYAQNSILKLTKMTEYSHKKSTYQIGLEDLHMDGDLDAVCANMGYNHSQILFNDGNGNLYYSRSLSQGNPKILISNKSNLSNSKELNSSINDYDVYHPYISKDDSFLILNSVTRPDSYGNADLYISYRNSNSHFGEPINLGNLINSSDADICSTLSPDGKYLFFTRLAYDEENNWTGKLFWVSTDIITNLQTTGKINIQ